MSLPRLVLAVVAMQGMDRTGPASVGVNPSEARIGQDTWKQAKGRARVTGGVHLGVRQGSIGCFGVVIVQQSLEDRRDDRHRPSVPGESV